MSRAEADPRSPDQLRADDLASALRSLDADGVAALLSLWPGVSTRDKEDALVAALRSGSADDPMSVLSQAHGPPTMPVVAEPAPDAPAHTEYDQVVPTDDAVLLCARVVHAAVEALNAEYNELTLPWEASRDSVIAGIRRLCLEPRETPAENHAAWMAYRVAEGWTYGPTKDPVAKTHPCMVPFEQLGPFQRSKDGLFIAIVSEFFGLRRRA